MILAIVKGNVVSTTKSEKLTGSKLLVVEEWNADTLKTSGRPLVALDLVGAGPGELVMCVSGSSARQTEETEKRPVDMAIVGIVDSVELNGGNQYSKYGPQKEEAPQAASAPVAAPKSQASAGKKVAQLPRKKAK